MDADIEKGCPILRLCFWGLGSVLPHLSNSWIIIIIGLYIALNRTPNVDCYWGWGGGGSTQGLGFRESRGSGFRGSGFGGLGFRA